MAQTQIKKKQPKVEIPEDEPEQEVLVLSDPPELEAEEELDFFPVGGGSMNHPF